LVRIFAGVSGCLRPLAIAYIADMFSEDGRRCKAITSLTLLSAIAVGFGPTLGAHLLEMDRSYPFYFMGGMSFLSLILVLLLLPETKTSKVILSIPNTPRCGLNRRRYIWTYRYLLALGFTTYFGAMLAAIAFPLSLKDDFHLDPVPAAICSIADGPLIFLSNFLFMQYLTTMSRGCKASLIASASFLLVALVPMMVDMSSLPGFLALKYSTSISGPIVFSAIPQTMMTVCPRNVCGSYAGLLIFYHGVGRLAATGVVGPLYHFDPASVYFLVASMGGISALLFLLLGHDLRKSKTPEDLGFAFLSESSESVASCQLSLLYPGTPAGGEVRIIARD
jgi:MFS family permease